MSPEGPILQALAAGPADELGWLALADCLEEQGRDADAYLLRLHRRLIAAEPGRQKQRMSLEMTRRLEAGGRPVGPRLVNSIGMEFALIPAGTFLMGSDGRGSHDDESPLHRVEITRPFWFGAYTVTQAEYRRVMKRNVSHFRKGGRRAAEVAGLDTSRFPAEGMTFDNARQFCERLGELPEEKEARRRYRLPSEAMWEYACRAGGQPGMRFHQGNRLTSRQANIDGASPDYGAPRTDRLGRTCEVGHYPPNAWGLYDMHGNVFEWCSDWYGYNYYEEGPACDPEGPEGGEVKVLRGGGYPYASYLCRAGYRNHSVPDNRLAEHGFRVVLLW